MPFPGMELLSGYKCVKLGWCYYCCGRHTNDRQSFSCRNTTLASTYIVIAMEAKTDIELRLCVLEII